MSDAGKRPGDGQGPRHFVTTRWTVVLRAGREGSPDAAGALAQLCQTYWFPLYAFARRQGHDPDEARDLTQEFFAQLLAGAGLSSADPSRGRFRTFLLASFKNLLANEWKRANRQKRGAGAQVLPLDAADPEERYSLEPTDESTPETVFERRWAEALLARVIDQLRAECDGEGSERARRFEVLKVFLLEEKGALPLADAAARLGLSLVATKGVVHRLRQRYREIFLDEIMHTVARPEEVDDEIRHLFRALAG